MKTHGKIWIIYNAETKKQTKPMSVVQAQITLLSLTNIPSRKLYIWTPGWEKWVCVRKFLDSNQSYFVAEKPPEPGSVVDEKTKTASVTVSSASSESEDLYTEIITGEGPIKPTEVGGYHDKDFNGDDLDYSKIKKMKFPKNKKNLARPIGTDESERRRDPRHNLKIEVVLVSKLRSFRTYSRNISLSGTLLENDIPRDFLNIPFDLIIVNPFEKDASKARLLFRAKIVGDMTNLRRLTFIEQDITMTARLDSLLKAYLASQKQSRKAAG